MYVWTSVEPNLETLSRIPAPGHTSTHPSTTTTTTTTACANTITVHPPLHLPQLPLPLPQHLDPLLSHDSQDALQARPPRVQTPLHLGPLLLAKDAVRAAVDEEGLVQLGQLALHQPRPDHVDDPHLHVFARDLQRARDVLVRQAPALRARGQRGEREQAHLAVQDRGVEGGDGEEVVVGLDEVVVVVQQLGVEHLEQLVPLRVRLAERLDGVAGGEVLEVKVGGLGEGGFEGADGEGAGLGRGDVVEGHGAEGAEEVEVRLRVLARFRGHGGNLEVQLALVFVVRLPGGDPAVEVLKLGAEDLEGGGTADDAQDREEDVVAGVVCRGEDVEDCRQDGERETGTVRRGGLYGSGEVLAYFGEEFVEVL